MSSDAKKVYVVGDNYRAPTVSVFKQAGYDVTVEFGEADVYVFTGGEDIYPGLYGEKPMPGTHWNSKRDHFEVEMYQNIPKEKFKVGICRGAQLLNVMNGGKMWQDVNNHQGGNHYIYINKIKGLFKDDRFLSNSAHHQMMVPSLKGETIGTAQVSDYRMRQNKEIRGSFFVDTEIVWYPEDKAFCFQAHPEFGHGETNAAFFTLLKHYGI